MRIDIRILQENIPFQRIYIINNTAPKRRGKGGPMDRTILHCDLNGFYASVECIRDPSLRDVPMAVAGDPKARHGIILAKNELAKRAGVVTAQTVASAQRICPGLVLVPPRHDVYEDYSRKVNAIYERYTDLIEPFGIDESWLDVTGSLHLFGDGRQIADALRQTLRRELNLTISVGVSFNKIFAKLGSDYKKPDATTVITHENYQEIVWPLPVTALLYVGRVAERTLDGLRIRTIGDLARCDRGLLASRMGKAGEMLYDYANGLESSPVASYYGEHEVKSIGNGMTFSHDLSEAEDIRWAVALLSDSVATRLRRQAAECRVVQVQVKDPNFKSLSRQKKLTAPTCVAREIARAAFALLMDNRHAYSAIRTLTITGEQIVRQGQENEQISFFEDDGKASREKQLRLEQTMDHIRGKYGRGAITTGRVMRPRDDGQEES